MLLMVQAELNLGTPNVCNLTRPLDPSVPLLRGAPISRWLPSPVTMLEVTMSKPTTSSQTLQLSTIAEMKPRKTQQLLRASTPQDLVAEPDTCLCEFPATDPFEQHFTLNCVFTPNPLLIAMLAAQV